MQNWPTKKLGEVCELVRGTEPGSERYFEESNKNTIRFIRVGDLSGKMDNPKFISKELDNIVMVKPEEILISFDGSPGIVSRGWNGAIASGIRVIRDIKSDILKDFLFYYLQTSSIQEVIKFYTTGVTILHASRAIPHIEIPLPPLPIQHQIVSRLDAIKKAQELNDKQIALADELFQSLLYKELRTKAKYWETKKIKELANMVGSGSTPRGGKQVYKKEGIFFIRSQNVRMNELDFSDIVYIDEKTDEKMKRTRVFTGDILLNITGASIGRVSVFPQHFRNANVNQHVCVIRLQNGILPQYISIYLSTKEGQAQILKMQIGATRQGLNFGQVKNLKIPLPPLQTQHKIMEKLQAVQGYKKKLLEQRSKLKELFDSALHKAMRGELVS